MGIEAFTTNSAEEIPSVNVMKLDKGDFLLDYGKRFDRFYNERGSQDLVIVFEDGEELPGISRDQEFRVK